jgi:predicted dehydrogenase
MTELQTNRRYFLATSMAGLAASASSKRLPASANEKVRIGVIGARGRGADLVSFFSKNDGFEIPVLCDVDSRVFSKAQNHLKKASQPVAKIESDFRKILDDKSIDAIAVATPDHWHALMAVMGCQAGKHVYCEKPVSHNLVEGRRIVEASRKYNRVVQCGIQRRSSASVKEAVDLVRSGVVGKVGMARAWIHQIRPNIGHGKPGEVPKGVDFAMWQGPAPDRPFMENRFHYNWHWFWNWGTGEIGNNGIHGVDVARWGLGVDGPTQVTSGGGKFVFDDDQEVPDTQIVTWEFPEKCVIQWEHRMWSKHPTEGSGFGIAWYGDKGTMVIGDKGWKIEDLDPKAPALAKSEGPSKDGMTAHVQNFLDCIKSGQKPNADIEIGHLSTRLCHLGNIAHRTGRKLTFDPATETFPGDPAANALLSREYSSRFAMPAQV